MIMTRRIERRMVWTLGGLLAIAAAGIGAQGVLAQFGVPEDVARKLVLDSIEEGGGSYYAPVAELAKRGYAKIAPAARAQATTALYAWTKTYVNSPAFRAAYAKMREEQKPQLRPVTGTPEQEAQARVNQQVQDAEESAKQVRPMIPPADLAKWDAQMKETIATLKSKPMLDSAVAEITERRAKDKADYDTAMKRWTTSLPADPNARIAAILREFLAATADVDFAAKTRIQVGEAGDARAFVNPAYNQKPWQWRLACDFGPEALAAARAAAQAWVNELGGK